MVRSIAIALATVAAIAAGSILDSPATAQRGSMGGGHMGGGGIGGGHMGGGGMGGGHMGGMGFGHVGGIGMGHAAFGHPGGFSHFGGPRAFAFHGNRFAFHNRFAFRHHPFFFRHHRFFRHSFAFIGGPLFAYDSCFRRIWTRWGWRWINLCDY